MPGRGNARQNTRKKRSRSASTENQRKRHRSPTPEVHICQKPTSTDIDSAEYRLIKLRNGLKVLLISSHENENANPDWTLKFPGYMSNEPDVEKLSLTPKLPSYLPVNRPSLGCGGGGSDGCSRGCGCFAGPECSISISVKAGSFADPLQFQGIAHFVEHVIHHGTTTFPGENSFSEFIQKHDGVTNACTDKTFTNYFAAIKSGRDSVRELCKRYGSMLTEPLLTVDSITREIESVDNEYFMRKSGHGFRQNHLLNVTTVKNEQHPLRKFSVGSKEGLMNPTVPNSNILLRDASVRFIRTHYFGPNMSVVVKSPESLDFLQECVVESFSGVSAESQYPDDLEECAEELPYDKALFNRAYSVKTSNMDGHMLFLTWALPPAMWKDYKLKTLKYLECILSHSAPGGLAHYLRTRGYVIGLKVANEGGMFRNDYTTLLQLQFILTESGRTCIEEVLLATFSYLKLHRQKGPQQEIIAQLDEADTIQLENFEMLTSLDQIMRISNQMHTYDDQDILVGDSTPRGRFVQKRIKRCLDLLTPSAVNMILFTSKISEPNLTEQIFGSRYIVGEPNLGSHLETYEKVRVYEEFLIMSALNAHLTHILNLTSESGEGDGQFVSEVGIIHSSKKVAMSCIPGGGMTSDQVGFYLEAKFNVTPKDGLRFRSVFEVLAFMLYLDLLPRIFHQVDAGFQCGVVAQDGAIAFIGRGLMSRGVIDCVMEYINRFDSFSSNINERIFEAAKQMWLNINFFQAAQPWTMARCLSLRLKYMDFLTPIEAYEKIKSFTFDDMRGLVTEVKRNMFFCCQALGKVRRSDAARLCTRLDNFVTCGISPEILERMKIAELQPLVNSYPVGYRCLRMKSLVQDEKVFAVANDYQMGTRDQVNDAMTMMICESLSEKICYKLRIQEQLGYMVALQPFATTDHSGVTIIVCGHIQKHTPCFIDHRIETFLTDYFQHEFTPEKVSQTIGSKRITQFDSPEVRKYFETHLLNAAFKSKVSIQVVPNDDFDAPNGMGNAESSDFQCHRSHWLPPANQIGNEKVDVMFAAGIDCESQSYFITSIDGFYQQK